MDKLNKSASSFGLSASVVILLSSIIMILKESSHGFHEVLSSITGNHWASHAIVDIVLFFVLGFVFTKLNLKGNTTLILSSVILGITLIVGYLVF